MAAKRSRNDENLLLQHEARERRLNRLPDWVKTESYAEFEEQMNIHCTTEAEKQKAREQRLMLRRKIKNRVSRRFHLTSYRG